MQNQPTEEDKLNLKRDVQKRFRGGMTPHLSKLVHESEAIYKQFIPSWEEGLEFGRDEAFEEGRGVGNNYGLERLYEDRVIITPYFDCAAYCRYCFRKTRTIGGDGRVMSLEEIKSACEYIAGDPRIKTALITGGDPFANVEKLLETISQLSNIESLRNIRIGTRHILFDPDSIDDDVCQALNLIREKIRPKTISIFVSLNHPDELGSNVRHAIRRLRNAGIVIRGHTVLLKGVNDDASTILSLMEEFVSEEIIPYYLYHCMDVTGTSHLRTSVQRGLDILTELQTLSGTLTPQYVYVTPVGKHRLFPGANLNYVRIAGKKYIKSHSPYLARNFHAFTEKDTLPHLHEIASDGHIISYYLDGTDLRNAQN